MRGMKRSIGTSIIAILSILGALLCLAMAILMSFAFLAKPIGTTVDPATAPFVRSGMILGVLFIGGPGLWGIITGIGLWRLRPWARISTLIFSGLLIVMGLMAPLGILAIPMTPPPNTDASIMTGIKITITAFYLSLAAIGAWWMIYLTRPRVKGQFGDGSASTSVRLGPRSGRPVSISVIAWLLIIGSCFMPINMVLHYPMIFFGLVLSGWASNLLLILFGAVSLIAGIGLLRMRPFARLLALGYFTFGTVNALTFWTLPGASERFARLWSFMPAYIRTLPQPQIHPMAFAVMTIPMMIVLAYFLVKHKPAFKNSNPLPPPPAPVTAEAP